MNKQRKFGIALLVSFSVNALLIGFIAAQWIRGAGGPPAWRMASPSTFGRPDVAVIRKLRDFVDAEQAGPGESGAEMQAARDAVLQAMLMEPLNPDAVDAALTQLRVASDHSLEKTHRAIIKAAATMSAEERGELANFLARVSRGGPPVRFGDGPPGPGPR